MCLSGGCTTTSFRFSFFFRALPLLQSISFFFFPFAFDRILDPESFAFRLADAGIFLSNFLVKRARRFSDWLGTY
jgi:hypothetical protein